MGDTFWFKRVKAGIFYKTERLKLINNFEFLMIQLYDKICIQAWIYYDTGNLGKA